MKKETVADKLAKKTFASETMQKAWRLHIQAFGPILEPAFREDYQSRIHLTAALNKLGTRDVQGALEKLRSLQDKCQNEADRAAWCFFVGLCFEFAGARKQTVDLYQQANSHRHAFYLPHLKMAKLAYQDGVYDLAHWNFLQAAKCLREGTQTDQTPVLLAAVHTNHASCLVMMHRLTEAAAAIESARLLQPRQPGREAVEAILWAAMGDRARVEKLLEAVAVDTPMVFEQTRSSALEILEGKNPHFARTEPDREVLDGFWAWFAREEEALYSRLTAGEIEPVMQLLSRQLQALDPLPDHRVELGLQPREGRFHVILTDHYAAALEQVFTALLEGVPAECRERWSFEIRH